MCLRIIHRRIVIVTESHRYGRDAVKEKRAGGGAVVPVVVTCIIRESREHIDETTPKPNAFRISPLCVCVHLTGCAGWTVRRRYRSLPPWNLFFVHTHRRAQESVHKVR